jgi:hypothetical protein
VKAKVSALRVHAVTWILVVGTTLLFAAANWRMIHVAFATDPHCIPHKQLGDSSLRDGVFSAAESACAP